MSYARTYYDILQVSHDAEAIVIDAAYRRLAREYHPDLNKSPYASQIMKEINAAYKVLSDPNLRAAYDASSFRYQTPPIYSQPTTPKPADVIKKKSTWWRWLLVIPAWPVGALIPGALLRIVNGWWVSDTTLSWIWVEMIASGVDGYCGVLFLSLVAPKYKYGIAIDVGIISAILIGVGLIGLLYEWQGWNLKATISIVSLVATPIGVGIGIYKVWSDNEKP